MRVQILEQPPSSPGLIRVSLHLPLFSKIKITCFANFLPLNLQSLKKIRNF
jgi:hypothetical protein